MARPLRIQYPGAIYHVMSRGNAKQRIVNRSSDRQIFLDVLENVVERYRWLCHAYCLMSNHYHLLIETLEANLSRGMRQLNGVYTQCYNRRHGRVGHLFQGRFKAVLVQRNRHLLEVVRYIVLNPVEARIVTRPQDYRWSSYRATVGLATCPPLLSTQWILAQFGNNDDEARSRYRSFVATSIGEVPSSDQTTDAPFRGDGSFVQTHRPHLERVRNVREIPKRERFADRPLLEAVLHRSEQTSRDARNESIRRAYLDHSYGMAQIGRSIGLHPSTISKIVRGAARADSRFKT